MKKILKRISVLSCMLALTIGFVGSKTIEADALSKTVSISAELKDMTGVASKSKSYDVYVKFAHEAKEQYVGTATYSALSNSYKLKSTGKKTTLSKDSSAYVTIKGPNATGKRQNWTTNRVTIKNSIFGQSFKVTGKIGSTLTLK